nr:putative vomeronasal receptor-like protein 4 isoform X4 [Microcebus murinus]
MPFFLQAGIGLTANTLLLLFRTLTLFLDHRLKPHDLLTGNLALVHILMLLTMLFFSSGPFESLRFQNDIKCKALFFLSRVMRGLSICTTCLLSMLQAVTISPSSSWLGRFKQKSRHYVIHSLLFLWILNLSLCSNLLFMTIAASNVTQTQVLSFGIRGNPSTCTTCPSPRASPRRKGPPRSSCSWWYISEKRKWSLEIAHLKLSPSSFW